MRQLEKLNKIDDNVYMNKKS